MRILQISDTHLYADPNGLLLGLNTRDSFNAVIDAINQDTFTPDLIILSGDLSHDHSKESYQYLAERLQIFNANTYWLPGNHDTLDGMQKALAATQLLADKEIDVTEWRILLLNSLDPGKVPGFLSMQELSRLKKFINNALQKNLMLILHHQPIDIGSKWLDGVGLRNANEFNDIIKGVPKLRAVVFGHVHQAFDQVHEGIRYIGSPSTSIQFLPHSTEFALDKLAPGYRCFELDADGGIKTVVKRAINFKSKVDYSATGY